MSVSIFACQSPVIAKKKTLETGKCTKITVKLMKLKFKHIKDLENKNCFLSFTIANVIS